MTSFGAALRVAKHGWDDVPKVTLRFTLHPSTRTPRMQGTPAWAAVVSSLRENRRESLDGIGTLAICRKGLRLVESVDVAGTDERTASRDTRTNAGEVAGVG
jgi:hypothetical protein